MLIGVKQARTGYDPIGVGFSEADFAAAAGGLGCLGIRCEKLDQLEGALREGFTHRGPAVVDVRVDPQGYLDQVKSLRG